MSLVSEIQVIFFNHFTNLFELKYNYYYFLGIPDGKFLEKRRYKNADNNNEYFIPTDLVVGKDVIINGYSFHILECDEYTKKWYANNIIS